MYDGLGCESVDVRSQEHSRIDTALGSAIYAKPMLAILNCMTESLTLRKYKYHQLLILHAFEVAPFHLSKDTSQQSAQLPLLRSLSPLRI